MFKNVKLSLKRKVPSYQRKLPDWITNQENHKVWFQKREQSSRHHGAQLQEPSWGTLAESPDLINPGFSKGQHLRHHHVHKVRYARISQIQKHRVPFTRRSQGSHFKFAIQLKQHSHLHRFERWSGSRRQLWCWFPPLPQHEVKHSDFLSVGEVRCMRFSEKRGTWITGLQGTTLRTLSSRL